ncbi:MAG TPA: carbohydrate ABC transporter permease [Chloroflexota bacterium]
MSATALAGPGRGGPLSGAVRRALLYLLTAALSLMFVFPFVWTLSSSLKTARDVVSYPPALLPPTIQWENYPVAWTTVEFGPYFLNSTIVTVTAVVGGTLTGLLVAYGFSRFRFPLRELLFALCLSTLMLPPEVTIIPLYIIFKNLGWLDTLAPLIVPSLLGGGAFTIFLLRQFILSLPFELDEAATIDGAGKVRILMEIIVPNAKPALATAAVFGFIAHWNEFLGPLIFLNSKKNFTIPLGLYTLRTYAGDPGEPKDHLLMAGSVIATLPIVLLFFAAQRYFVQGIVTSGLKR